jgi:exportin-1
MYESLGEIIASETDPQKREILVFKLMDLPNQSWQALITSANHNSEVLWDPKTVKQVVMVLKTNNRVAGSLGHGYIVQLSRIYVDMLQVYKMYSGYVSLKIQKEGKQKENMEMNEKYHLFKFTLFILFTYLFILLLLGPTQTRTAIVRSMRSVKKETLNLIRTFILNCQDSDKSVVLSNFLPALLDPVLDDYKRNVPDARDSEVLNLFSAIIEKLGSSLISHIPRIFESVFQCTLEMITRNFEDYPDHRIMFFKLLQAINQHSFQALLRLNSQQFQLVMDSIIWAMKHLERNIADTGLTIVNKKNISGSLYFKLTD